MANTPQPPPAAVPKPSQADKVRYSAYSALVFLIIASPFMFKLVQSLLGSIVTVASPSGCPTLAGLLIHTVVFFFIVWGMMNLKL